MLSLLLQTVPWSLPPLPCSNPYLAGVPEAVCQAVDLREDMMDEERLEQAAPSQVDQTLR